MKLYLLEQTENDGYDTYDSCVVAAEDEKIARSIRPDHSAWSNGMCAWAYSQTAVSVALIGTAARGTRRGVVLASFNAG